MKLSDLSQPKHDIRVTVGKPNYLGPTAVMLIKCCHASSKVVIRPLLTLEAVIFGGDELYWDSCVT